VRLIAEAKCWTPNAGGGKVPIDVVRNMQAVLADLQQTLPRDRKLRIDAAWEENLSCNYHGAIFSTVPFSKRAVEYANAYAIDLIPMDEDALGADIVMRLEVLRDVLTRCLDLGSPQFRDRRKSVYSPSSAERLRSARSLASLSGSDPARGLLLDLVEYVIFECSHSAGCEPLPPEIAEIRELLFASRLASVDSHVVVLNVPEQQFQSLRRFTARRFLRRATSPPGEGGVLDPFYPPPDHSPAGDNVLPPDTPYGKVQMRLREGHEAKGRKSRPKQDGFSDDGSGEFVKIMLSFEGEDIRGNLEQTNAHATISKELYNSVRANDRPRKVTVPVDFGCFYYGLLL
jgi:hypothetical protein